MKPARILILTAGYGEGHNAAARALVAACDAAHGPGTALLVDAFALASPRFNNFARNFYIGMINRTPRLWSSVYAWVDRNKVFPGGLAFLRSEMAVLERIIAAEKPTALCSTYPVYAYMLEKLARSGYDLPAHFNVVTDSISINSLWWRASCDGWFLPNPDSADVLRHAGIDESRLHVSGFPVTSFFSEHATEFQPPSLAGGATPRVLYIINSGTRFAEETAAALLAEADWSVTIAVGRDEALRQKLQKLTAGRMHPATILGWTDQIPQLLMTHHVVVSKAGGATTQEAIAARCPMIVNQIVPGQEEGNYELLRRYGVGGLGETPTAIVHELRRAFAQRGLVWNQWRTTLAGLARPEAARHIVTHILHGTGFPARAAGPHASSEPVPLPLRPGAVSPTTA